MSMYTLREQTRRSKSYHGKTEPRCPVCQGLECLCRPRYFSGQLLTESELNAEQQYVVKKNRLHNLYLHGYGVVCGLEVICHPSCKGWVTIKQGYAISPCGDDVILCQDVDFPVVDRIDECLRKERKREDCAPYAPTNVDCDSDGCWYLTVEYDEQATRALTALRADTQASVPVCTCQSRDCTNGGCSCGCGCGGSTGRMSGCGCGGGGATMVANGRSAQNGYNGHNGTTATTTRTRTPLNVPCEPTRICEGYKLDICRVPAATKQDCEELLAGTLLGRLYDCFVETVELIQLAPEEGDEMSDVQRYSACCQYLTEVRAFFDTHATASCELLDELATIACPKPGQETNSYAQAVDQAVGDAAGLVWRHLLDCICLELLPPCPPDPGDDRLILACVCVQDGKIVDVCNFKGRKQVVTWPAVRYWMSALPIELVISQFLERLCCGEYGNVLSLPRESLRSFSVSEWTRGGRLDPTCNPLQLLVLFVLLIAGFGKAGYRASAGQH